MTIAQWEPLFDELAELAPEARERRLADLRETDPDLARFLDELLAADRCSEQLWGEPLLAADPQFVVEAFGGPDPAKTSVEPVDPAASASLGEVIGPYRLVAQVGEGGMGEVYLAERSDGEFEQRVALKRIRAGLDSDSISDRFLRERQILARLHHPGIARLLDGGRTEQGDPYFVMEYVEGEPITDWCRAHEATLDTRLRLGLEVIDAIDAAHRQLVVHRDLKPSNILVTTDGHAKLLDFGIAKVLAESLDQLQTQLDARPLTPAYAAPEQILGEPVTTATDVYALGMLLYELLAGRPPFERRWRALPELIRGLERETVERPSMAANGSEDEPPRNFAARLAGDLDTIVLKALHRDPEQRYPSAAALGDDLRRYLAGKPVHARPDTVGYRARKFIARHRLAVGAAAVVVVSLVGGLAAALWQARVAQAEARRAERVKGFLVDLFREADPSRTLGDTITARQILDQGARRVDQELTDEPAVRAELLDAIAQVERSLGLYEPAAEHAEQSLIARRTSSPLDRAASLVTLAEIHFDRGDLDAAESALAEARDLARRLEPTTPLGLRWAAVQFVVHTQRFDSEAAEALARATIAALGAERPGDALEVAHWQLGLAVVFIDSSRVVQAEPLVREVLPVLERDDAGPPLRLATTRLQAAEILDLLGDEVGAERWMRAGLALERQTLGPDHPDVALWEIKLGYFLSERRDYDEAERVLTHAATVLQGIGHYEAGSALRYLGFVDMSRERFEQAHQRFLDAERIYTASLGPNGPYPQAARLSQGWALMRAGRYREARAALEASAKELEAHEGAMGLSLRTARKYLGEVLRALGDPTAALDLHRSALATEIEVYGKQEHVAIASSRHQIALDLLALGGAPALAEAREEVDRAIALVRTLDADAPRLDDFLEASARIAIAAGDNARARRDLEEAVVRYRAHDGPQHARTRAAEALLANLDAAPDGARSATAG